MRTSHQPVDPRGGGGPGHSFRNDHRPVEEGDRGVEGRNRSLENSPKDEGQGSHWNLPKDGIKVPCARSRQELAETRSMPQQGSQSGSAIQRHTGCALATRQHHASSQEAGTKATEATAQKEYDELMIHRKGTYVYKILCLYF